MSVISGFLAWSVEECCPTPDPQVKPDEVSPEAKRLLAIATDPTQDYQDRVRAVSDLSQFRGPGVVTPLLRMLPGKNDALTYQVVNTLGVMGDPRAIDPLEKMLNDATIEYHGKIRAAIRIGIEDCKRNRVPGGP